MRKCWCILQDRALIVFTNPTDTQPEGMLDIRDATVTPQEQGIIRVKTSQGEYWLKCLSHADSMKWLRFVFLVLCVSRN